VALLGKLLHMDVKKLGRFTEPVSRVKELHGLALWRWGRRRAVWRAWRGSA
jgi:hypothetical protein